MGIKSFEREGAWEDSGFFSKTIRTTRTRMKIISENQNQLIKYRLNNSSYKTNNLFSILSRLLLLDCQLAALCEKIANFFILL